MASFTHLTGVHPDVTLGFQETGYLGRDAAIDGRITANGDQIDIRIHGLIVDSNPVSLEGNDTTLIIGSSGIIDGQSLSSASGSAVFWSVSDFSSPAAGRLYNAGQVLGGGFGIFMEVEDAEDVGAVTNTGTIMAETTAVYLRGEGLSWITNSGLIDGFVYGISVTNPGFEVFESSIPVLELTNSGVIRGLTAAIFADSGADRVVNTGLLDGDVVMGDGADLVDNRGGLIWGSIDLGLGTDRIVLGAGAETVNGGAGIDVIDYRFGGAVEVALDASFDSAGAAVNDEFVAVENIFGSRTGADLLRGNHAANLLRGEGGADTLDGAGAADVLIGGRGADRLTGGLGNDTFAFQNLDQIGDVITDFSAAAGNDDRFQITAAGFGGGLLAGALVAAQFRSRADNVAQDADDRFIFRTTDHTLWFDADGTGTGAAVMVADLQAGAVVTAADFLLV